MHYRRWGESKSPAKVSNPKIYESYGILGTDY
jgi:hypothetical protein